MQRLTMLKSMNQVPHTTRQHRTWHQMLVTIMHLWITLIPVQLSLKMIPLSYWVNFSIQTKRFTIITFVERMDAVISLKMKISKLAASETNFNMNGYWEGQAMQKRMEFGGLCMWREKEYTVSYAENTTANPAKTKAKHSQQYHQHVSNQVHW